MNKLDQADAGIIAALTLAATQTNRAIARQVGISEQSVAQRIRRLINDGVIRMVLQRSIFRAEPALSGFMCEFHFDDLAYLDAAVALLSDMPETITLYTTSSKPELIGHFWAIDRVGFSRIVQFFETAISGLTKLAVLPLIDLTLYRGEYGDLRAARNARLPQLNGKEDPQLELLAADFRQTVRSLSERLGIPQSTLRSRIAAITRDGSIRFALVVDASSIGRIIWADIRASIRPECMAEVMASLSGNENLSFVGRLSGPENLALFCLEQSLEDFDRFIASTVRILPGLETFRIMRVTKVVWHNPHFAL